MLMPGTAIVADSNAIIQCILLAVFEYAMLPIFDEYMFDMKTGYGSL